eukprot:TRINITY_DN50062_c0_g1_i1.p1 TRINITY_DN50062_c0_g1~~TRINITY_DN50062_c0_g1_i1.p1  ORF type:complete len:503 (-),score=96.54 TRINITY_DN50062_c0_g1_i1:306-1814(-)
MTSALMAKGWPEPEEGPLNFATLQRSLRTGVERRLVDEKVALEQFASECAKSSEESAVQRSEAILVPRLVALGGRLDARLDEVCARIQALDERASAAEARLGDVEAKAVEHSERTETQADAAAAARAVMLAEMRASVRDLTSQDAIAEERRLAMEINFSERLAAAVETASAARKQLAEESAAHVERARVHMASLYDSCMTRCGVLTDMMGVDRHEAESRTEAVVNRLQSHEEASSALDQRAQRQLWELRYHTDESFDASAAELRATRLKLEATSHDTFTSLGEKLQAMTHQMADEHLIAHRYADSLHEEHHRNIRRTADIFHSTVSQHRETLGAEVDKIHSKCVASEAQASKLAAESEKAVLRVTGERADSSISVLKREIDLIHSSISGHVKDLRHEIGEQSRVGIERSERRDKSTRTECQAATEAAVARIAAQLRTELDGALRDVSRRLESLLITHHERVLRSSSRAELNGEVSVGGFSNQVTQSAFEASFSATRGLQNAS